jgi:hypothetical protein
MADIPPQISGDLRKWLLAAESLCKVRRNTLTQFCHAAYDAFLEDERRLGASVTTNLLRKVIPTRVCQWALERGWLPATPDVQMIIRGCVDFRIQHWMKALELEEQRAATNPSDLVALLDRIIKKIGWEQFCHDYKVARSTVDVWRAAGGAALHGKIKPAKAEQIETAVRKAAKDHKLDG